MSYAQDAVDLYNDIRQSGGPIVLERASTVVSNFATDTQSGGAPTKYPHWAIILSNLPDYTDSYAKGTLTRQFHRKIIMPAYNLAITPQPGDKVSFAGLLWTIATVATLMVDGITPLLYTCEVQ